MINYYFKYLIIWSFKFFSPLHIHPLIVSIGKVEHDRSAVIQWASIGHIAVRPLLGIDPEAYGFNPLPGRGPLTLAAALGDVVFPASSGGEVHAEYDDHK